MCLGPRMETKKVLVLGSESETESEIESRSLDEVNMEEPHCSEIEMMEMETAEDEISRASNESKHGTEIVAFSSEKGEGGTHGNVVFSREAPLVIKEDSSISACSCGAEKLKSRLAASNSEPGKNGRKLSRQDRIELGRLFQGAVSSHDWELAESLILLADPQTLNDALCISLDSIWFLSTQQELYGITGLIKKIIANGAYDFTRAALRTSFLASCVSACQSRTMSLADTVTVMAQSWTLKFNLHYADDALAEVVLKLYLAFLLRLVQLIRKFLPRALRNSTLPPSRLHERLQECNGDEVLKAEAGNHLTGKDFTEAFDAACFPLTLFSSSFDPGWASGISATAIQGLLGMLVEGGADNVNQCFLEASRFGSTELVRILLQIAQRNSLDVDVDLALGFASHYGKIGTMECLVEEAATSSSQVEVAAYLLPHVPHHVLAALSIEILKAAGERSGGSLNGVAFLLHSDFLGDPAATYAVADSIARSDDEAVAPELKSFLQSTGLRKLFRTD
ncbi:UNVERIFIED_CONTAM: Ankyrin repeat protein SKIP35 [Sesamum radiatum]|uniref:Ankyrin repeat protein SKIP35 n=1 Tax=Sesamum radiatum TaxID=300843 RepID=A0AAW2SIQ1_SESRA